MTKQNGMKEIVAWCITEQRELGRFDVPFWEIGAGGMDSGIGKAIECASKHEEETAHRVNTHSA